MAEADLSRELGGHPLVNAAAGMALTAGGSLAFLLLLPLLLGRGGGFVSLVLMVPWLLYAVHALGLVLEGAGNCTLFRRALRAVAGGEIGLGWVGRDALCSGICVVDEGRRRLFLNGRIVPFEDVRGVEFHSDARRHHVVDIRLAAGARPFERLRFDSEADMAVFFTRLGNALGLEHLS